MRARIAVAALSVTLVGTTALVAQAQIAANGLPRHTEGYARWTKLNRKPITAPGAHNGVKNVYASKRRAANGRFPNGTVIVKSIAKPGASGPPFQVAVMRKVAGKWRWVEYERTGGRYGVLAQGSLCSSCHMQAQANDWVFTRR